MAGVRLDCAAYLPILKPMSIALDLGQVVGVIGPNGAGKSTLLRLMAGLIAPTSGQVVVADLPLTSQSPRWRAQQIAYLPQFIGDDIPFTVREFVEMGRYSRESAFAQGSSRQEAVMAAVAQMGLERLLDLPLAQISGGERQRAGIARCLAQASPVFLLDEPIANLDVFYQLDILSRLRGLAADGRLIVLAIHHLEFAMRFCDACIVLDHGAVVAFGSRDEVFQTELVQRVFHIGARRFADPFTGDPRLSVMGCLPAKDGEEREES
ncbi:iron complex transport system ATP-binding protein [Alicyclobacillus hesperidum]|uniref:Iron complex transport system ATP-binding protein n=1 Tax=Alicyclobacillus hesperidum TaxID=89784 RepID=A0A1H2U505_9BACL|nr:ABC transporter ATP-binding protein [Alicyclobacillus hesperidum]SDW51131.1 iron complex transport system ATP-binding protein [Alicyclobacillus hesperidum]